MRIQCGFEEVFDRGRGEKQRGSAVEAVAQRDYFLGHQRDALDGEVFNRVRKQSDVEGARRPGDQCRWQFRAPRKALSLCRVAGPLIHLEFSV